MSDLSDSLLIPRPLGCNPGAEAIILHGEQSNVSAGAMLRQAREGAGLHIAALAVSLKVPVKKLEALESDQFDLLPDAVFVRALASSVCRTLKIDAAPVLERLPQTSRPKLTYRSVGINTPFRVPGDGPGPSIWAQVSRPAVLGGIVLLLGALVLIFLPSLKSGVDGVRPANIGPDKLSAAVAAVQAASAAIPIPDTANVDINPTASTLTTAMLSGSVPGASSAVAAVPDSAVAATSPASLAGPDSAKFNLVKPAATATSLSAPTPAGIVVFSARGDSWVEVTDAKGLVVLRRTLSAGEVVGASGALPLATVVGRADATQVQVRGKAFDVSAFAKDNVARFEVK